MHGLGTAHASPSSSKVSPSETLFHFIRHSLESYAQLVLPFVNDAWHLVVQRASPDLIQDILQLDELHHASLSNQVSRRASKAQGAALLSLYARSFAAPPSHQQSDQDVLVSELKQLALSPASGFQSHLPICWAVVCAALGITLGKLPKMPFFETHCKRCRRTEKTRHLHLFLHARSIVSAAIRLNLVGPYLAHRVLALDIKPLLDEVLSGTKQHTGAPLLRQPSTATSESKKRCETSLQDWLHAERQLHHRATEGNNSSMHTAGPANTWPLQDIVSARHDSLHSRIFNS